MPMMPAKTVLDLIRKRNRASNGPLLPTDRELRERHPSLNEAYEKYQVLLNLYKVKK